MSSIIGLAYTSWAPDIHMGSGAGRHIEEIRRLASRMDSMTKESERALAEAQMLYGVHVFARAKGVPDLAVSRGEAAYRQARVIGDRHLELGDDQAAASWLDRAVATSAEAPTPFRARMVEVWRGSVAAATGDVTQMQAHLGRAARLATEQGLAAARCEALAMLALHAADWGARRGDDDLLALAESSAEEAKELAALLPGRPPWRAQSDAALAGVALSRGDSRRAVELAMSALSELQSALHEDLHLEILLPVADVVMAAGSQAEQDLVRFLLQIVLAMTAQRTLDEQIRVRWFRGPVGSRLVERVGSPDERVIRPTEEARAPVLGEADAELLRWLTQGLTNREIAERMGQDEASVARRLGEMFARLGTSSRSEATAFAFREHVV
jgi:DNA-binding CsgD family transcriptional regulator